MKGIPASSGVVISKVFKLQQPTITIENKTTNNEEECFKFIESLNKTINDIEKVKERASNNLSQDELAIFDAHLMMINDPELKDQILAKINEGYSAEKAVKEVSDSMILMFESMDNDYFKERAADIKDVSYRLLCNVLGLVIPDLSAIDEEVIIVANDLTPSETAQLNKKYVKGFITEIGGRTSHSAIMARSLEIPAIVGVGDILNKIEHGQVVVLDGLTGDVILNPNENQIKQYQEKAINYHAELEELKKLKDSKTITVDEHEVELASNIGSVNDLEGVLKNGAQGVGLFRTEFLYMDETEDFPSEQAQFNAYKAVLETMNPKKVVVRTLDIGGDKKLDYFEFPKEMNPFLGYRAIRLCLDRKDIFKTQIRALLKASVYGKLAIMFPMIATVDEFIQAKNFVLETKQELLNEGEKVADDFEIGMMVEIPAAAVLADQFSKYADFFSIGTNDLIQYSMAADRMSEKVAYLYQPLNPSILRLIKMTIDGAHKNGKWCGMCGEMAGDNAAAPVLLGLGLDEFSMSSSSILKTRKLINSLSYSKMQEMALECVNQDNIEAVQAVIYKYL